MNTREAKRLKRLERIAKRKAAAAEVPDVLLVMEEAGPETETEAGPVQFLVEKVDLAVEMPAVQDALEQPLQPISGVLTHSPVDALPSASEPRLAKVYGIPPNRRIRLIEFQDGSHGKLWVKADAQKMLGWSVWVRSDGEKYILHGVYNTRGTRMR
jgi:hypothetical protein